VFLSANSPRVFGEQNFDLTVERTVTTPENVPAGWLVGVRVGWVVGCRVGCVVGRLMGCSDGWDVGCWVGCAVGWNVGRTDGPKMKSRRKENVTAIDRETEQDEGCWRVADWFLRSRLPQARTRDQTVRN